MCYWQEVDVPSSKSKGERQTGEALSVSRLTVTFLSLYKTSSIHPPLLFFHCLRFPILLSPSFPSSTTTVSVDLSGVADA